MKACGIILFASALFSVAMASCPNKCSGHGQCGVNDICLCEQNWVNPDCSGRQCPFSRAWQDTAMYTNDAHFYAECGNRGVCDRSSGICTCDADFEGSGCQRMSCPGACNGHGTCHFMEELASYTWIPRVGGQTGFTYTQWDQEKIMGCICDPWWQGHGCENRVCPMGDDPLTTQTNMYTQVDQQQYVQISGPTVNFALTYFDPYGNAFTTPSITSLATAILTCPLLQTALNRLPRYAMYGVTVSVAGTNVNPITRNPTTGVITQGTLYTVASVSPAQVCIVVFPSQPGSTGNQNHLACDVTDHSTLGSQPLFTATSSATCIVGEQDSTGGSAGAGALQLTELISCSNRGVCDAATGDCQCFTGHKGVACEMQDALV